MARARAREGTGTVVGKDHYGNEVYEGQVEIKDAHGNRVYRDADVGSGPAHHKDKHPNGVNTGKKDAHGNDIWHTPGADDKAEE